MINLRTRRIVVTGGAGFLGSAVQKVLLSRGISKNLIFVPRSSNASVEISRAA